MVYPKSEIQFGNKVINTSQRIIELSITNSKNIFYNDSKDELNEELLKDLYTITNGKTFLEYVGVYKEKEEGVLEAEKKERKIITFVQEGI